MGHGLDHAWHVQINGYKQVHEPQPEKSADHDGKRFMYEAKDAAGEVSRLALLFGMERRRELPVIHRQCSDDHAGEPVPDNHLTCCLSVECRTCPHLAAIDRVTTARNYMVQPSMEEAVPDEQRDVMKAWTCVTHILMRGGDSAREGYVLTVDDRMFSSNVYDSLSQGAASPAVDDGSAEG